jgi:cytoskeletal protein RodZ
LSQITMRLLQRDLEQRYATAEDAIRDLLTCRDAPRNGGTELTEVLQARFPGQKPERTSRARAAVRDKLAPVHSAPGRAKPGLRSGHKLGLIVIAVVVAATVATLTMVTLTAKHDEPPQLPTSPTAAKAVEPAPLAAPIEPIAPKASTETAASQGSGALSTSTAETPAATAPSTAAEVLSLPSRTGQPNAAAPASSRTRPPKAKGSAKAHSLTPARNALEGEGE